METVKVIYRLEKCQDGNYHPIVFFPECHANYGNIMCFSLYDKCHGEASLAYYNETKPIADNLRMEVNNYMSRLYFEDEPRIVLKPMRKLNMNDLRLLAWGIY